VLPGRADVFNPGNIHADPVNLRIGRNRPDRDGNIVVALLLEEKVVEQERLTVFFLDATAELPAHQRVHFGVFVSSRVDPIEEASSIEAIKMFVQVGVGPTLSFNVHEVARKTYVLDNSTIASLPPRQLSFAIRSRTVPQATGTPNHVQPVYKPVRPNRKVGSSSLTRLRLPQIS